MASNSHLKDFDNPVYSGEELQTGPKKTGSGNGGNTYSAIQPVTTTTTTTTEERKLLNPIYGEEIIANTYSSTSPHMVSASPVSSQLSEVMTKTSTQSSGARQYETLDQPEYDVSQHPGVGSSGGRLSNHAAATSSFSAKYEMLDQPEYDVAHPNARGDEPGHAPSASLSTGIPQYTVPGQPPNYDVTHPETRGRNGTRHGTTNSTTSGADYDVTHHDTNNISMSGLDQPEYDVAYPDNREGEVTANGVSAMDQPKYDVAYPDTRHD